MTTSPSLPKEAAGAAQQKLFENLPDKPASDESSSNTINKKPVKSKNLPSRKVLNENFRSVEAIFLSSIIFPVF